MTKSILTVIALFGALTTSSTAHAQSVTVFGNTDAQACYIQTRLFSGSSDALTFCDKALKSTDLTTKDRAATLVNRGINLSRSEKHDLALADYRQAIELMPDLAEAYLNRGNTYIFRSQFRLALADYDRALELGTKEPYAAYYNRGLAYEALKDLKSAYKDFLHAQELRPDWSYPAERIARYQAADFRHQK